jgi:purine-binding chemotaxis protein CheW
MKQPADDHAWHKVHDRLSRAAQAIASSQGDFEQHATAAFQARTRELARRPQQRSELAELLEIITFMLGGESYAIEAKYVYEIMAPLQITAIPGTPEFLSGVINLRGEILAVFDFKPLFGLASGTTEGAPRLIVLGEAQPQFGFLADTVDQVKTLEAAELTQPVAPWGLLRREAVRGITTDALLILDGRTILADERLIIEQREDGAIA